MERTKQSKKEIKTMSDTQIRTLASMLTSRAAFAAKIGTQYSGERDLYKALGYPEPDSLVFRDFYGRYTRQDIAKAIIDRPVKATWQGPLELIESSEAEDTEFELKWKQLDKEFGIKSRLSRVDKLTGIGQYGVLLLGLSDVTSIEGFASPVKVSDKLKLLYIKPYSEESAKIDTFVEDSKSPRYGLPLTYTISVADMTMRTTASVKVHYSRVIHITDEPLESEVYGTPRLEAVFNTLMDIDKISGGDAEMFWRGARPGYTGKLDKDYMMTEDTKTDLLNQLDEYEHDIRRFLINDGVEVKALEQQVTDPVPHFTIQIQKISAQTGIPNRVLMGSERGELSSAQDSSEWKEYVQARRDDHAEPNIIRPLVTKLVELKILPKPKQDYTVKWADLYSQSEKAKVEIGKGRANALREYTYSPVSQVLVPPDAFMQFFLGLTTEQITLIDAMRTKDIKDEELSAVLLEKFMNEGKPAEPVNEQPVEE